MLGWIEWQDRVGFSDAHLSNLSGISERNLRRLRRGGIPSLKTALRLIGVSRTHPAPLRDKRRRGQSIDLESFDRWGALSAG